MLRDCFPVSNWHSNSIRTKLKSISLMTYWNGFRIHNMLSFIWSVREGTIAQHGEGAIAQHGPLETFPPGTYWLPNEDKPVKYLFLISFILVNICMKYTDLTLGYITYLHGRNKKTSSVFFTAWVTWRSKLENPDHLPMLQFFQLVEKRGVRVAGDPQLLLKQPSNTMFLSPH